MGKSDKSHADALAALNVGATEQTRRMCAVPQKGAKERIHASVEFSVEGMDLLRKVQAALLVRGVARAGAKGRAIEFVLAEWLALQS